MMLSTLVVNLQWPATTLLVLEAPVSFAQLLEPAKHCAREHLLVADALLMLQVVSAALQPIWSQIKKKLSNLLFI